MDPNSRPRAPKTRTRLNGCCWSWGSNIGIPVPIGRRPTGKVERFWRTLNDDLIDGTTFASLAEFRDELEQYLLYYNEVRPHQALEGKTPKQINESCQRITEHIQG